MPLSLEDVEDLIDSWEIDPDVDTLEPAAALLSSMSVGDPGRADVLEVIADHQAMRGELDAALATLQDAAADPGADVDVVLAMRAAFLLEGGREEEADPLLRELRRRGPSLPVEARERVGDTLEERGRLHEAMRWFTIGLRDLDPLRDVPDYDEEYALIGRRRVRTALGLPPDHYDDLARVVLETRLARSDEWD
jgi:tetratricopeptide (TPR) repeat protein